LQCINEKIAALAAKKPTGDIYASFSLVAHLATEAIRVATELEKIPGVDAEQLKPVIAFWYSVGDCARVAALNCAGGCQTLAEALVTFRLLQDIDA
jgi:hypothetical protein